MTIGQQVKTTESKTCQYRVAYFGNGRTYEHEIANEFRTKPFYIRFKELRLLVYSDHD